MFSVINLFDQDVSHGHAHGKICPANGKDSMSNQIFQRFFLYPIVSEKHGSYMHI